MEGETTLLKALVELKRRYRAYLYLDEAHSIGCMGRRGRGLCEHAGVDPSDVDVLMGAVHCCPSGVGVKGSRGVGRRWPLGEGVADGSDTVPLANSEPEVT